MTTSFGYANAGQRNQYLADSVLSAPPARLLTMLYDRLLLDLARAETGSCWIWPGPKRRSSRPTGRWPRRTSCTPRPS
jgi:hypothetical protein